MICCVVPAITEMYCEQSYSNIDCWLATVVGRKMGPQLPGRKSVEFFCTPHDSNFALLNECVDLLLQRKSFGANHWVVLYGWRSLVRLAGHYVERIAQVTIAV